MTQQTQSDQLCINTLRTLSIDAVQQANSGHPGRPMGSPPTAYCLWQRFLRYDPAGPEWLNRDRFVLSAGHASALLYSLRYLTGVKAEGPHYDNDDRPAVTLDALKSFRQAGSRCPGHPEYGWTSGVETTTGPLGQGAATYNRPGFQLFDNNVYALCSDGDMMEGISKEHQARSAAARNWKRSLVVRQGLRTTQAGRNQGTRYQHAVMETVREAEPGIS